MEASSSKDLSIIFMISMSTLMWLRCCENEERYIFNKVSEISLFDKSRCCKYQERNVKCQMPNAMY